jgi:predicted  nucleic acid-binding Zn-ribbon protein
LKSTHSKISSEYEELQKQCSLLKTRCHQLESERLPLIAQLEFADRNLRQVKKQQQQQTAMTTSTTVHHQTSTSTNSVLQSIENNNKSISRLIRSPSLDMRVLRRTSIFNYSKFYFLYIFLDDKMDDTRPLDNDDLALLLHKNQSFNHFPL